MAHRLVPNEKASTPEEAEFVVRDESGGACIPTGRTEPVEGGWAVQVFSMDGHSTVPDGATGRSTFTVISVDGANVQLRDSVGFDFSVSRHSLDCDIVKVGQILSGVYRGPGWIEDVVNESQGERPGFTASVQPEGLSWTPGIATGEGFEKR